MAKHTLIHELAAKIGVPGIIEARIHCPIPAFFRVPGYRQFQQPSFRRPVQESTRVVARAYDVLNFSLDYINFLAGGIELVATLVILTAAAVHRVVAVRGG